MLTKKIQVPNGKTYCKLNITIYAPKWNIFFFIHSLIFLNSFLYRRKPSAKITREHVDYPYFYLCWLLSPLLSFQGISSTCRGTTAEQTPAVSDGLITGDLELTGKEPNSRGVTGITAWQPDSWEAVENEKKGGDRVVLFEKALLRNSCRACVTWWWMVEQGGQDSTCALSHLTRLYAKTWWQSGPQLVWNSMPGSEKYFASFSPLGQNQ